ncbi:MAG TPA: Type 1 glutamine amidotransferase-like domain-containing protein [Archangium sp.]|uniref:Type 1 glutamine amidotransferase-like domain-containing protein n=1 Tax=Archangium sp. TaxID=1872627 RepID=UPI002E33ABCB|nr:Type 1 glutamine amidotransferase-like domain-containing protein [Archangium sp.]HEX5748566.1 Type 1 glutamine amidotransferase-like domain-containing protein [Archangium sp.]
MKTPLKPLFLLADSSLLFWRVGDKPFLDCLRVLTGADLAVPPIQAAYLGASNGDVPAFFELFTAAMELAGITHCRMIPSRPTDEDREWLAGAHVILLAGGDPLLGWESFRENGLEPVLRQRYLDGAVLMGISAGAMQLGERAWSESGPGASALFPVLGLAPFIVGAHEQPEWAELKRAVREAGPGVRGIGIPAGGGALLHPDQSLEPVRHPLVELRHEEGALRETLLYPPREPYRGEVRLLPSSLLQ